ncbi:MAG: LamB/YcsF family protein [Negativicutes bacterium]|nr:LamB/YcsF family protein [Negativicutes bacterium]
MIKEFTGRPTVDINCDAGEGFGLYRLGCDRQIMPYLTSVNIACGFHASDPVHMQETVRLAKQYGVAVGAHPSYPDLQGFGRRDMDLSGEEITAAIIYQVGALAGFCRAEGVKMVHVKPHGALYNRAADDLTVALAVAGAVRLIDRELILVGLANSAMVEAAARVGIACRQEAFADREYTSGGRLMPRSRPGAIISDVEKICQRVADMVANRRIIAADGSEIACNVQTVCLHSDTPQAVKIAAALRQTLTATTALGPGDGRN